MPSNYGKRKNDPDFQNRVCSAMAEHIIKYRENNGIGVLESLDKDHLDTSCAVYYDILRGRRIPILSTIEKFADVIDVDIDTFIGRSSALKKQNDAPALPTAAIIRAIDNLPPDKVESIYRHILKHHIRFE